MEASKKASTEGLVSIKGLDKGEVLAALYNAASPVGMGYLQYNPKPMTPEEARNILKSQTDFDYLNGRPLKVNLSDEEAFDPRIYDSYNGQNAAAEVIRVLRKTHSVRAPQILKKQIEKVIKDTTPGFSEDKRIQLSRLADGDPEALSVCFSLMMRYTLLDPEQNPDYLKEFFDSNKEFFNKEFFDSLDPQKAKKWYSEKDPLDLLEKAGIKGAELTKLYNETFKRNANVMFLSLVLLLDPEDPNSYRTFNGLPPLRK
ncbi:MAG: hypothetical protein QXS81_03375 [Candidatus Micrarchaeaceae archaeon]